MLSYGSLTIECRKNEPVDQFLGQLVGRLRSDDLYNVTIHYPEPKERSGALAVQASIVFVLLGFLPEVLKNETAAMREIVDKLFPDNWVISVYMGTVFVLPEAWEQYKLVY